MCKRGPRNAPVVARFIAAVKVAQKTGVDNGLTDIVKCMTPLYTGARAIGLRGRLLCRRPDEPDLDNTSVGRTPSMRIDAAGNASSGFFLVTS